MDHISNLLTAIRNAELASLSETAAVDTKLSRAVLAVLKSEGYIGDFSQVEGGKLSIVLAQPLERHHYKRVSKPSRRMYTDAVSIPTVRQGMGMVILSTPEGVMTGKEARKRHLGGEIICEVY